MKKLKGVFKPLKCYFKGNLHSDWFPMLWCSKPAFIHIMSVDVGWKDKYDTPRYEYPPAIWIHLFGINLIWYWDIKRDEYTDDYWEQALWYLHYYHTYSQGLLDKPNIEKAKEAIIEAGKILAKQRGLPFDISISFGAVEFGPENSDLNTLITLADKEQYIEKRKHHAGRK